MRRSGFLTSTLFPTKAVTTLALGAAVLVGGATLVPSASADAAVSTPPSAVYLSSLAQPITDHLGRVWAPDAPYAQGGSVSTTSHVITGTTESALYQTHRFAMAGYHVPIASGSVSVTLNLAEHYWTQAGRRVFGVTAEGKSVASNVDVVARVGEFAAYNLTFTVPVTDGVLDLGFPTKVDNAMVSSLSIISTPVVAPPTTPPITPPTTTPPTTPPPIQPAAYVTPESFGARGDGVTDDTVALQKALDSGSATTAVRLTAGRTYVHTAVLHIRRAGLNLTGAGVLLATNEQNSSVWIEADNVLVDGVVFKTTGTTQRWSAWEQMGLRVVGHQGTTLRNIVVDGSAAAGLYVGDQATNFVLDHFKVQNTRDVGILMTMGANNGKVISPIVRNSGDDGVAIVSYSADGVACHDITVTSPTVLGTTWGRGLSVVGGTRITETGIDVERTSAAGVYIAA
ncbi:MAG: hypothetical protein JWM76_396, partial [Pseudonocardiales bacterium]|nr:hypothetical protein [Pseudonocardiales bacterium]